MSEDKRVLDFVFSPAARQAVQDIYEQGRADERERAEREMTAIIDKALADPWTVVVGLDVVDALFNVVRSDEGRNTE